MSLAPSLRQGSKAAIRLHHNAVQALASSSRSSSSPVQRCFATSRPSASTASDTSKAAAQMRRFWKNVSLHTEHEQGHHEVKLDKRSLRTPEGQLLKVPGENKLLASLIVHEWNEQNKVIKSHALPMTSLVARSIDAFGPQSPAAAREQSIVDMLRYAETDTLCFHESEPKALVRLQEEHWDPILDWVKERFGTRPVVAQDTLLVTQPTELLEALRNHVVSLKPLEMAGLEKCLHLTKSLYLSLALLDGRVTVQQAMLAAWVETLAQMETWGEVEDSHDVGWAELGRELGAVRMTSALSV